MALATYTELQTAVAAWLHHETMAAAQVQELIRLAEEQITADLAQCAFMQTSSDISVSASTFTLPVTANSLISARLTSPDRPVDVVMASQLPVSTAEGPPRECAVTGGTDAGLLTVSVYPTPDTTYTLRATYSQAAPALSGSRAANFVLLRAPSLYLYGSLLAGEALGVNDARMPMWQDRYDRALLNFRGLGFDGDVMLSTDLPITRGNAYSILEG